MDFVLESGNGEPDDTIDPAINTESVDGELSQVDNKNNPSSEAHVEAHPPSSPGIRSREGSRTLAHWASRHGKQHPPFHPTGASRELRPGRRSWPLRDPEEAYLLKHFVDRIASFVSPSFARQRGPSPDLTGFSSTAQTGSNTSPCTSRTAPDIAIHCSMPSWPCRPAI